MRCRRVGRDMALGLTGRTAASLQLTELSGLPGPLGERPRAQLRGACPDLLGVRAAGIFGVPR
jgi:hypothetical protein